MLVKFKTKESEEYTPKKSVMANALKYAYESLNEDDINFLANLPAQHTEEFEGLKVLFVHGSPEKNNEGITPDMKYSILAKIFENVDANLVFCGHTHYPIIHQVDKKTIINTGSVGRPFGENPRSVYAVLDLTNVKQREFSIDHRYVKYDHMKTAEELSACNFDGAKVLGYMHERATDKFPEHSEVN
jgi:predicted phosphodiesterase